MHQHPSVELWCISLFKEYGKWYTGVLCVCVWYERSAKEYEYTRPRRTTEDEYSQSAHTGSHLVLEIQHVHSASRLPIRS